ncbi:hypothetical protein J7E93_08255 [Streptomyces sp. ISL-36]|uniref:hypothetical protein n=1 Tax=Streptomyces sp. ISL-36 TaxID=2819182 RepID=UPI001BEB86F9|nr:hypothetical protein [Streptomyces sp. ISL-36]MBT2440108.1 hypothetical protein [Streptomyces sp. ISL-36]
MAEDRNISFDVVDRVEVAMAVAFQGNRGSQHVDQVDVHQSAQDMEVALRGDRGSQQLAVWQVGRRRRMAVVP